MDGAVGRRGELRWAAWRDPSPHPPPERRVPATPRRIRPEGLLPTRCEIPLAARAPPTRGRMEIGSRPGSARRGVTACSTPSHAVPRRLAYPPLPGLGHASRVPPAIPVLAEPGEEPETGSAQA